MLLHRMKAVHKLVAGFGIAALCSGCGRESVSVTVGPNGAWTRRALFVASNVKVGGKSEAPEGPISDFFAIPTGAGWKVRAWTTKDEHRLSAERTLPIGQSIENDIVVKETGLSDPAASAAAAPETPPAVAQPLGLARTLTTNRATVRQTSRGTFEYSETIHWTGDIPEGLHAFDAKEVGVVRSSLPKSLATDANVKRVSDAFIREFDLALVGPPRPLIHSMPLLMSAPETFERRIMDRLGAGLNADLKQQFGESLTASQRAEITGSLIRGITEQMRASNESSDGPMPNRPGNKNSSGASIFVSVRLPGRVTDTNGIADRFSGVVTWSFYPEAAALGDVTLWAKSDATSSR